MVLRVANADVLPYDYVEFARTMRRYLAPIDHAVADRHWIAVRPLACQRSTGWSARRERFNAARDSTPRRRHRSGTLQPTNRALMQVERALIRPGAAHRAWFRNLIYVADENNGYANMAMPSVNEAIRGNDETLTRNEIADLAARFDRAAAMLGNATRCPARG